MYTNTITLFNRYKSPLGDVWYAKILKNVDLIVDKAAINARYGAESSDTAKLHVRYDGLNDDIFVGGYKYYTPKMWEDLPNDDLAQAITFRSGQNFDFFIEGEHEFLNPIDDNDFKDGFYNYINKEYDNVFVISSVSSPYKVIKHFEIMGK